MPLFSGIYRLLCSCRRSQQNEQAHAIHNPRRFHPPPACSLRRHHIHVPRTHHFARRRRTSIHCKASPAHARFRQWRFVLLLNPGRLIWSNGHGEHESDPWQDRQLDGDYWPCYSAHFIRPVRTHCHPLPYSPTQISNSALLPGRPILDQDYVHAVRR